MSATKTRSLKELDQKIIDCERCPRLRSYCKTIAREKRKQFENDTYWGKPVPGFGDSKAQLLIVGLAPAAHGGNRTGRMFTGDNSGVWLYRALHKAGFANQALCVSRGDGLKLKNAYICAVARCAPPDNKPLPKEIAACAEYIDTELALLKNVRVIICLGQIALQNFWNHLPAEVKPIKTKPKFVHGAQFELKDGRKMIASFHPSQQNTFTKKLTEPMFDSIFSQAKHFIES